MPRITISDSGQTTTYNGPDQPDKPDDNLQRISSVYFAKKAVTQNGAHVAFTRIDSAHAQTDAAGVALTYDAILGQTVYLVIETANMAEMEIDVIFKPSNTTMTGTTDSLRLMRFDPAGAVGSEYVGTTLFTAKVGTHSALNNRNGSHAHYTNLAADHINKAIIKLQLRPSTVALFNTWATNIGANAVNIEVIVERHDNQPCAYGTTSAVEMNGAETFLNTSASGRLRLVNRKMYLIYHGANLYNIFPVVQNRRRRLGRVANARSTEAVYFYYDQHDIQHRICSRDVTSAIQKRRSRAAIPAVAQRGALQSTLSFAVNRAAGESIDASELRMYANGTLGLGDGGQIWYANQGVTQVELINFDIIGAAGVGPQIFNAFDYNQNGVRIRYGFMNTRRRYIRPDLFAGFIGALAQFRQEGHTHLVVSQGFSFSDGSCYPSAEHVNGEAGDLNLLTTALDGSSTLLSDADFDYANQVIFNNLLFDFGFSSMRSERFTNPSAGVRTPTILPHSVNTTVPRHNNHLHIYSFASIPNIYE
jgi:hypothetical protein